MDVNKFWDLVEEARHAAGSPSGAEETVARATALLAAREPQEIIDAQQILWDLMATSYRAPLWAAAYLINGGCSDDGFDYFRGWLIAQGRIVFEDVVADADKLADLEVVREAVADGMELEREGTLGIARNAHREATGEELPDGTVTIRYPALDPDWNFDFDDTDRIATRLPRVAALCRHDS
ncbi:DUF4240 domain-containing protein [Streptomyces sp. SID7909]|uniref:DUF4240 domain-containing protein n=1 Tax=Streptomyces sp. SID7909 TaxID=2706092 RepID=UPI0013B615B8|nr:DUF4240 domain-containing protein [Streptomyces sp. SID7909]NEC03710.1 DUF4240 domain-containing protein [Streptomyces sp. SID7909]